MFRRYASVAWKYKKTTLFAVGATFAGYRLTKMRLAKTASLTIHPQTVLTWRITDGLIVESPTQVDMGDSGLLSKILNNALRDPDEITVLEALLSLELAAKDPRIEAIAIDLTTSSKNGRGNAGSAGISMAQAQELRAALLNFRELKKQQHGADSGRVYFYVDSFDDQATYYLASACSDIIVQPSGTLPLTGVFATQFFVRRLADKLGIKPVAESRKDYKSVMSMLTETKMPAKQRENMASMLESLNDMLVSDIVGFNPEGATEPLTTEAVRKAMAEGPLSAPEAVDRHLISRCGYALDVKSIIGPRKSFGISAYRVVRQKELSRLNAEATDTVGVVYLLGAIQRNGMHSARSIANTLLTTAEDSSVSAIVLRIDSGGGDVVASETIACAVEHIQNTVGKPVIASYGSTSASGAVFASAMCRKIFADPATVTGSIGVASVRPVFTDKLLDYAGLNIEELRTVDNRTFSLIEESSGAELQRFKKRIDQTYDDFVGRVAKGRNFTSEQAEAVAQGQVFTGAQAKANGLVDELGGLTRAIEAAAQLGHKTDDKYEADITENVSVKVSVPKTMVGLRHLTKPLVSQMLRAEAERLLLQETSQNVDAKLDDIYFK
ncbi:hypothetical protein IW140_004968 [Coemansia sp. RSA 1813]|nr:hypothetical protein EV178_005567 [Coemansia sp. RSA 1646]KAJ2086165.1 hypothetical protein IW138_005881 [Coemansia sp. RSA 986]KAJ2210844.1 hypothetical protein EV179_005963 [Coemansia sp. RSA 487]KAJ2566280.1 hypothetical protein IW140_004968 [Coemansia sp. RSA 1813]